MILLGCYKGLEEVMGTLCEMVAAMKEKATAAHHMMERMEQRDEKNSEGHNGGVEVDLEYLKVAEFRKANPSNFKGAYNLDRADEWIKAIKKIFTVLACTEEQKVAFATYMLKADIEFWWVGIKRCWKVLEPPSLGMCSRYHFMRSIFPLS